MSDPTPPTKELLLAAFRAGHLPKASDWQFLIERLFDTYQDTADLINKHGEVVSYYQSLPKSPTTSLTSKRTSPPSTERWTPISEPLHWISKL